MSRFTGDIAMFCQFVRILMHDARARSSVVSKTHSQFTALLANTRKARMDQGCVCHIYNGG